MEAAPTAPFEVTEPDLLFEFLIVALDAPAQFGEVDQPMEGDLFGNGREPIFCRLGFTIRPLDQQPFFRTALGEIVIAVGDANAQAGKARGGLFGRAFAPRDCAPGLCRQGQGEFFDRDRLMIAITPYQPRRPWPDHLLGRSGAMPGAHTVVFGRMPAT
jgi:hypothetical protein